MNLVSLEIWFWRLILPFISAAVITFMVHPYIIKIANLKQIVDAPSARKQQKKPVPVVGGVAVFFGIIVGAGLTSLYFNSNALFSSVVVLTLMLFIGMTDDIIGMSPRARLFIEMFIVFFVMFKDNVGIENLYGLFGIEQLSMFETVVLSFLGGVGIVNAMNLIDGVDGLASGICMLACASFGVFFCAGSDGTMAVLCALGGGALIPFFLHNIFGLKSKMFIGDGGTLMMGALMVIFTFHVLSNHSKVAYNYPNMGVVAFCLAVLSIPVFDTLRVMTGRIKKGISPFYADRTHLHHLFVDCGFSHIGTSITIILLNLMTILLWFLSWQLGANATIQFVVVFVIGVFNTFGIAYVIKQMGSDSLLHRMVKKWAEITHWEVGSIFMFMRRIMDKW